MIESYTTEEAVNCCTKYIRDGNAIGLPVHTHEGRTGEMCCVERKVRTNVEQEIIQEAHFAALNQLVSMDKWVEKHLYEIRSMDPGRTERIVQRQHRTQFTMRIKEQDIPRNENTEESRLAYGPLSQITTWEGYDINGYRFHTKEKDKKSASQNCGVRYEGIDEATQVTKSYYGRIEEIWELDYGGDLQIPIFRCQWVKPRAVVIDDCGLTNDDCGLTIVELENVGYKDDEWVLASRVAQVAFYPKPKHPKKHVAVSRKQSIVGADGIESPEEYNNYAEFSLFTNHIDKTKTIKECIMRPNMIPWFRPDGEKRTVVAPAPK